MLDAGCWMLDVGCWIVDCGCWMLDVGSLKSNHIWKMFCRLFEVSSGLSTYEKSYRYIDKKEKKTRCDAAFFCANSFSHYDSGCEHQVNKQQIPHMHAGYL
jgi:hypothetical protein